MTPPSAASNLTEHARQKLVRVLGDERAEEVLSSVLKEADLRAIETLAELERFADVLKSRSGFDATVGAMLAVDAAMLRLRNASS